MTRVVYLLCSLFVGTYICSQESLTNSAIILDSVVVLADIHSDVRLINIENEPINHSLLYGIQANSSSFIKNYGLGQLSSWSVRGSSSTHNGIYWNGIDINSPMLGLLDLAQIRNTRFESVQYAEIGADNENIRIGGILSMDFNPRSIKSEVAGSILYSGIGEWSTRLSQSKNSSRGTYHNEIVFRNSDNAFRYVGRDKEITKAIHASFNEWSIKHNNVINLAAHKSIQANIWLRGYTSELSPSLYQNTSTATQEDENYRVNLQFDNQRNSWPFKIQWAIVHDRIHYNDSDTKIDDSASSSKYIAKVITSQSVGLWHLRLGSEYQFTRAYSDNYNEHQNRHLVKFFAKAQRKISNSLYNSTLLNLTWINGQLSTPSIFNRTSFHLSPRTKMFGEIGYVQNIPTLNDLFWSPGGNSDLIPEKATKSSIGIISNLKNSNNWGFTLGADLFSNWVKDWILWRPITGQIWSPINIRSVWSRGISFETEATKNIDDIGVLRIKWDTELVKATYQNQLTQNDQSKGQQLIYIPHWKSNILIESSVHTWVTSFRGTFLSSVFATTDNSVSIPSYFVGNLSISKKISTNSIHVEGSLLANNLFNKSYQSILDRPLPLRYFSLQFIFKY